MRIRIQKTALAIALSTVCCGAMAHGFVSLNDEGNIISRVALCHLEGSEGQAKNMDCGNIQYEPQSVEGFGGFPEDGPDDGYIASAAVAMARNLDEQTSERWQKRSIEAGSQDFEWTFRADHKTTNFKYYITNEGWNQNAPLERAGFDLTPFCEVDGHGEETQGMATHRCDVPEREGYHVILAVWEIDDTPMAFYNVIDVNFDGDDSQLPGWGNAGQIIPTMNLKEGDAVYTRVFDGSGENAALSTRLEITDSEAGQSKNWSKALATKVNQEHDDIKSGVWSESGFDPIYGVNPIYVNKDSGIQRVEIGYDVEVPEPDTSLTVEGLEPEYVIGEEATVLDLTLVAEGDAKAEFTVYNHGRESLAHWSGEVEDDSSESVALPLSKSEAGHHMLVVSVKNSEDKLVGQQTLNFHLIEAGTPPPEHDYVYPEGFGSYVDGDIVLFEGEGVYQCFGSWAEQCNEEAYLPGVAEDPNWVEQQWKKLD
ncbi:N-acetylglucosamine-binding protein GbpA [Vibrio lentus]|uniref:N-acetylglucosamine-binding protein GbpA n=1 Tax=Vibrio lentus TaxID=136468 RepID=UPI000C85B891|nr:N-acetylglucosamine-binding protein GbpA [Vibrio lentus]MCC4782775.1 N-acetylglucosamine-binding protein GbpA [Vibrio lentus]PMJ05279.1 N-acetylglucosamine-binding protein A [Vibrio lentus]TKG17770.1 N-acetylglucosamine-binding protein GbpA [Vibrio lentus]